MICPRCGGELQATSNPNKLQCEDCGRVFKNQTSSIDLLKRGVDIWQETR